MILGKWPTWRTILFCVFIYIFNSLHQACQTEGPPRATLVTFVLSWGPHTTANWSHLIKIIAEYFDAEYIYGFVWWGVCKQSRWRHSVTVPSEDSGYVLLWQRYDNNKMVAMRYYGNVMTTTLSQYSDDVSSVTNAGCICAPVNAITTCIYFTHRSDHTKTSVRR